MAMLPSLMGRQSFKIGIVYGGISEQKAGMDHFLHQILLALNDMAPEHRYVLIDHRRRKSPFRDCFEQLILDLPGGPLALTRWNLLTVPRVLPQFDLVFSPGLYGPVRIPSEVSSVMVVPDLTRYLFPHFFSFNPVQKWLDRFAYPAMLKRYDHLVTISHSTQKDLMTLFKIPEEKTSVVYPWADNLFQPVGDRETLGPFLKKYGLKKPFILFLSTLEPRKNLGTLLKAFAGIKEQIPHELVLVGQKGWKIDPVFKEMERPELKGRVHWVGYVPDAERVFFYNAAEFLVFPSWYEGFGMPLLEAMQCGCPVITSKTSSMPEVVGEAALLINPGSTEECQQAMLRLVSERETAEHLRQAGGEQAVNFSGPLSASKILEIFEKLIENKKAD